MSGTPRGRGLMVGGTLAALTLLGGALAHAQVQQGQINLQDPSAAISTEQGAAINLTVREDANQRFLAPDALPEVEGPRRLELELAAGGADSPLDVSISQRASLGADADGNIDRAGRGSELRVGRGLVGRRDEEGNRDSVYMFVASDDEALTFEPGARSEFGGRGSRVAIEDRAEVGDLSAGVTIERNGVQTSLAYVEREVSTTLGNQSYSRDENFAGVTVTMRR